MNDVEAKENRNLQTRLIHRDSLHLVARRATNVERRTEQPLANQVEMFRTKVASLRRRVVEAGRVFLRESSAQARR